MKAPADPTTTLAFSYLRFSSPAQADGDSVRRQTALRDGWLARNPNVRLDTTLNLEDRGVSGFRGRHREDRKHALAQFLDLVERGRVPVGSYLIVENLDRLSREQPLEVMGLVRDLVRAGVRVVQLVPETIFDSDMDDGALCMLLLGAIRGHGESKRKSGLSGEAWMAKKNGARAERKPHGKAVPAWLELVDGHYRIREDAGRAVRRIFTLSAEGLGTLAISRRLNEEGVPPIARGERWIRSYVAKILDNRAALGEYQPMKGRHQRTPDGEPVPGYWPPVVTQAEWDRARLAKEHRNKRSGRPGRKGDFVYPFSGLVRCARDGCPLHVVKRRGRRFLVSGDANQAVPGAHWQPFPLEEFSGALLEHLAELQASDLFQDPGAERLNALEGRLADVDRRLNVAVQRFTDDPESPTWADQVSRFDRDKRSLVRELAEARQEAANPLSATWAEALELMKQQEPERLRAALLGTIDAVWCLFTPRGDRVEAAVQVWFKAPAEAKPEQQAMRFLQLVWVRYGKDQGKVSLEGNVRLEHPQAARMEITDLRHYRDDEGVRVFWDYVAPALDGQPEESSKPT